MLRVRLQRSVRRLRCQARQSGARGTLPCVRKCGVVFRLMLAIAGSVNAHGQTSGALSSLTAVAAVAVSTTVGATTASGKTSSPPDTENTADKKYVPKQPASPFTLAPEARRLTQVGQYEAAYDLTAQALAIILSAPSGFQQVLPFVYDDLSSLSYKLNRFDRALQQIELAHEAMLALTGTSYFSEIGIAHIENNWATLLGISGNYRKAEQLLLKSLARYATLPEQWLKRIEVGNNLVKIYRATEQYAAAQRRIAKHIRLLKTKEGRASLLALQIMEQSRLALATGETLLADQSLQQLENEAQVYSVAVQRQVRLVRAQVWVAQSKLVPAETLLTGLLKEFTSVAKNTNYPDPKTLKKDPMTLATAQYLLARIYILQGKTAEAEPLIQQALEQYRKGVSDKHPAIARSLHALAIVKKDMGNYQSAQLLYEKALSVLTTIFAQDHGDTAGTRLEYSLLLTHMGLSTQAAEQAQAAIAVLVKKNDPLRLGRAYSAMGFAQFEAHAYGAAEKSFKNAIALMENAGGVLSADLPPGLIKLAEIAIIQGRFEQAQQWIDRAIALLDQLGAVSTYGLVKALSVRADLYHQLGQHQRAEKSAQRFMQLLRQRLHISRNASVSSHMAQRRDLRGLFKLYLDIMKSVGACRVDGINLDALFTAAQYPHMTGTDSAITRMAARLNTRDAAMAQKLRRREQLARRWQQLQDHAHDQTLLRNNSIDLSATLQHIENEIQGIDQALRQTHPKTAELMHAQPVTTAQLQGQLAADEALFLHFTQGRSTHVFLVTQDNVLHHETALSSEQLWQQVKAIRHSVDLMRPAFSKSKVIPAFNFSDAFDLYQHLFFPFSTALADKSHLIIVADGALQNLPPALLVTEAPGAVNTLAADYRRVRFFGHEMALSVAPSVSSLVSLRRADAVNQSPKAFLGFGDPDLYPIEGITNAEPKLSLADLAQQLLSFGDAQALRKIFDPLPNTRAELEKIADQFDDATLYFHAEATESRVKSIPLSDYRYISFATHGLFAGELAGLMEPALILTPPRAAQGDNDGLLTASEIAGWALNAEWVVLSACNTAAGRPGAEGLSGLAKAFFHAGTQSLLVSHWHVNSLAAARLSVSVFEAYNRPINDDNSRIRKAQALQYAMRNLAQGDQGVASHPAYWAPFVVVGDGQ